MVFVTLVCLTEERQYIGTNQISLAIACIFQISAAVESMDGYSIKYYKMIKRYLLIFFPYLAVRHFLGSEIPLKSVCKVETKSEKKWREDHVLIICFLFRFRCVFIDSILFCTVECRNGWAQKMTSAADIGEIISPVVYPSRFNAYRLFAVFWTQLNLL